MSLYSIAGWNPNAALRGQVVNPTGAIYAAQPATNWMSGLGWVPLAGAAAMSGNKAVSTAGRAFGGFKVGSLLGGPIGGVIGGGLGLLSGLFGGGGEKAPAGHDWSAYYQSQGIPKSTADHAAIRRKDGTWSDADVVAFFAQAGYGPAGGEMGGGEGRAPFVAPAPFVKPKEISWKEFIRENREMRNYGERLMAGKPNAYLKPIGQVGGPIFENMLRGVSADATRQVLEGSAARGMTGGTVDQAIGETVGNLASQYRWQDMLRAMEGRKWLTSMGTDIKNKALAFDQSRITGQQAFQTDTAQMANSYNLSRASMENNYNANMASIENQYQLGLLDYNSAMAQLAENQRQYNEKQDSSGWGDLIGGLGDLLLGGTGNLFGGTASTRTASTGIPMGTPVTPIYRGTLAQMALPQTTTRLPWYQPQQTSMFA